MIVILFSTSIIAAPNEEYFHVYGAFGEIFSVGSIRAGRKDWEVGILNRRFIGYNQLYYKDKFYGTFGAGINLNVSPGIFTGLGYEYYFWKIFSFRAEANGSYSVDNYSASEVQAGITIYW
jgi:hypothetical protein